MKIIQYKNAAILWKIAAFLFSTIFSLFQEFLTEENVELQGDKSKAKWIVPFLVQKSMEMLLHLGRSPPFNLIFR